MFAKTIPLRYSYKVLSLFLAVALVFTIISPYASATVEDAVDYTVDTFWGNLKAIATLNPEGYEYRSLSEFWKELISTEESSTAYTSYVDGLQTELGTVSLFNGGVRYYLPADNIDDGPGPVSVGDSVLGSPFYFNASGTDDSQYCYVTFDDSYTVPFTCSYTVGKSLSMKNARLSWAAPPLTGELVVGEWIPTFKSMRFYLDGTYGKGHITEVTGRVWIDFVPLSSSYFESLTSDVTINSRPTVFNAPVGYYLENGDLTVLDNVNLVDETNNTTYNPVTNTTYDMSDWAYDYSTRTYNITLSTGDTVAVTYGDENITYVEGDTTYNVYYVTPSGGGDTGGGNSGGGSGGTPVPSDPSDPDFPGGVDDPDTEDNEGWSFFDLLKTLKDGAWNIITGLLGAFFGGIAGLASSFASIGDFFDVFDSGGPDNIFGIVDYGGADIWD